MSITLSALQKQRTDTAANWTAENPTLLAGELGFESDTGKAKLGTGSTAWNSLGYLGVIPSSGIYPLSQLLLPSGTAAAPSLSFDGDTDTGLYRTGANAVAISTGGSGRLLIDANGNVQTNGAADRSSFLTVGGHTFGKSLIFDTGSGNDVQILNYRSTKTIFGNSGSEQMWLDSSGRLGLGTSSADAKIQIVDTGTAQIRVGYNTTSAFAKIGRTSGGIYEISSEEAGAQIRLQTSDSANTPVTALTIDRFQRVGIGATTVNAPFHVKTGTGGGAAPNVFTKALLESADRAYLEFSSSSTGLGALLFSDDASSRGSIFYDHNDDHMRFGTAGTERLRITSTGEFEFTGAGTAGTTQAVYFSGSAPVNSLVIDSAGKVGLGTNNPSSKLEVVETTAAEALRIDGAAGGYALVVNGGSARSTAIKQAVIGNSYIGTTPPTDGLIVQGSVGIGTTSPGSALNIVNTAADNTSGIRLKGHASGNIGCIFTDLNNLNLAVAGAHTFTNFDGTAEHARIDSSGRLLVGTNTQTGGNLLQSFGNLGLTKTASGNQINFYGTAIEFVNRNGTARAMDFYVGANGGAPVASLSTAGVWTNASDIKNKENIKNIAYGIETIKALVPRQYDVKSNGKHAIGFVAQEVLPIIPEVVHESFIETTQETHLGLDYGSMVAVLTKALQEAITKIETLEAKVAALEAQ